VQLLSQRNYLLKLSKVTNYYWVILFPAICTAGIELNLVSNRMPVCEECCLHCGAARDYFLKKFYSAIVKYFPGIK